MAVEAPVGQIKGVIMFFSGSSGGSWWGDADPTLTTPFFNDLLNEGYELVQVRWKANGWFGAPLGNPLGFAQSVRCSIERGLALVFFKVNEVVDAWSTNLQNEFPIRDLWAGGWRCESKTADHENCNNRDNRQ
jgi:hypothetical protein